MTVLLPLRQRREDRTHMKLSLHRIKFITSEYLSPDLLEIFSANDLWNCRHSGPILPATVNTNGVKLPCSICMTRSFYVLFFSASCFLRMEWIEALFCEALSGLVTLTSKKAFWPLRQNPRALTSNRASALTLALRAERSSVVTGCRWGSDSTSWQTWESKEASKSRMLSCLALMKPPLLQFIAWVTSNLEPQTQ